ncbi:MAG: hypothetical protein ACQERF_12560 [Actinomycetota bacterium]
MTLLDRYATAVARRIPPMRGKADFTRWLRDELDEKLAQQARTAGRPPDEAMERELLAELGSPARYAASRNPYPHLIGPRLFPTFTFVATILIGVLVTVLLVTTGISIALRAPTSAIDVLGAMGNGLAGILSAALGAFGAVTLTFAIIERVVPADRIDLEVAGAADEPWDPDTLAAKPQQDPDRVRPWESVVAIVLLVGVLVLFNVFPDVIGFHFFADGAWTVAPLLTDAFFRWLPLLNLAWAAEIVLHTWLLRTGRWTPLPRLASIAIKVLQLVVLVLLVTGPDIIGLTPELVAEVGDTDLETAGTVVMWIQRAVRFALWLGILGTVVDIVRFGYHTVRQAFAPAH